MFVRYWQAALLAALAALMGNVVWAQESWPQGGFATGYAPPAVQVSCPPAAAQAKCGEATTCCETGDCCKEGKCCKEADCCKEGKCCKANKCDCAKGGECCCKKGECKCNKSSCCKGTCGGCCTIPAKSIKSIKIIVVIPSPPFGACPACHLETGSMPPYAPQVMLPCPPPPPMLTPPGLPMPGMTSPILPPQMVGMPILPPACYGCPVATPYITKVHAGHETCVMLLNLASELSSVVRPLNKSSLCASAMGLLTEACAQTAHAATSPSPGYLLHPPQCTPSLSFDAMYSCTPDGCMTATLPQPTVVPCCTSAAKSPTKLCIVAKPASDQLEMSVGDNNCLRCKKMTVTIGDNEITLSRFDDRVRIRGDELKATADSVRSERKDRLILEGDVVLHYKKDGHCANVTGDRIELNLSSGAVTIKPAAKSSVCPSVRIDTIEATPK